MPSETLSASLGTRPLQFRYFPVLFAAVCFSGGIAAAHSLWISPALLAIAVLLCAAISVLAAYRAPRASLLPLAATFFLLGGFCFEAAPQPDPQTQLAFLADGTARTIEGRVTKIGTVRQVETVLPFSNKIRAEKSQQMQITLSAVSKDDGTMLPLRGGVSFSIYAPLDAVFPEVACGDTVQTTLEMHLVDRYLDPGVWDERAYMLGEGIGAVGSARLDALSVLQKASHPSASCWLHSMQQKTSMRLIAFAESQQAQGHAFFRIDREDATMLTAMLTGDRSYLSRGVRTGFERTGSFHLLVVSGMHLAIFAGLIFSLAKLLRLPRAAATIATIAIAFAYALFTGYGQPVQRSLWMIALFLIGRLLWRERIALNAIGFAALGLLATNPHALFEAGFQMTLLSVLAIAGIAVPIGEKTFAPYLSALNHLWLLPLDPALPPRVAQFRVSLRMIVEHARLLAGRRVAHCIPSLVRIALRAVELQLISVIVECVMALPMALYFHRITAAALPVNLLIVPMLGILLPSAILTLLAVLIVPALASWPAAATATVLHAVVWTVRTFSSARSIDLRVSTPTMTAILLWLLCTAFAVWIVRKQRFAIAACFLFLLAGAFAVISPHEMLYRHGALEITTIDVGQGDSLLIISPEGKTLLVDAGGIAGASPEAKFDMGEDVVSQVLWARGIRRLDAVAITHAHADHIGGMPSVLANFRPRELWIGINPDSVPYDRILAEAAALGIRLQRHTAGDAFQFGSVHVQVLSPERDYRPKGVPTNDDSLVLRMSYGNTSALLEGDAEAPSEARMLARGGLHADLLKVGHHGSKTSTTPAFLKAVSPEFAAISVGRRNYYGHPKYETLEKLEDAHASTYRTDLLGASTFYLDGTRITTSGWRALP